VPAGAIPNTYSGSLTVRNSVTGCLSAGIPITVQVIANPSVTPGPNVAVCSGTTTVDFTFAGITGGADTYSLLFDAIAQGVGFADVVAGNALTSPIAIAVPAAAAAATYNATFRVINTTTNCFTDYPITVTINANPTITLGANPAVCSGVTTANLTYSATTANEYTLDFDAIAEGQNFVDVTPFAALAGAPSQIAIIVPAGALPATYNASLTIRITATGCTTTMPVQVTVNPNPTITLDFTDPEVCSGTTSVGITYSATTGSPDQYSIDFDPIAEGQTFADVSNLPLASPIVITVPA